MASLSVRKKAANELRLGVTALLLSFGSDDDRESLLIRPLFFDAFKRLAIEPVTLIRSLRISMGGSLV